MKQKLTYLALFIFSSCLIYGLISPANATRSLLVQSSTQQYFPLGAMQNQIDWDHLYFTKPDKFGMNLWHHCNNYD